MYHKQSAECLVMFIMRPSKVRACEHWAKPLFVSTCVTIKACSESKQHHFRPSCQRSEVFLCILQCTLMRTYIFMQYRIFTTKQYARRTNQASYRVQFRAWAQLQFHTLRLMRIPRTARDSIRKPPLRVCLARRYTNNNDIFFDTIRLLAFVYGYMKCWPSTVKWFFSK